MKRKIIPKQEYTTYAKYPLVPGDVRAYEIELDLGRDVLGAEFKVTAIRADGKVIEDIGEVKEGVCRYTMANSMYSVPGELTVRLTVLESSSVLTDREIIFEVKDGVSSTDAGETTVPINDSVILRLSSIEQKLFEKVDKVSGKGLSKNDFTDEYKAKLDTLDATVGAEVERVSVEVDNLSDSFDEHLKDNQNPHKVTASQVGAYTKEEVDIELNRKVNVLKGSASGEVISLTDISPIEHNMAVKVSSKNMVPYPYAEGTHTENGVTFIDNGDGSIRIIGTATGNYAFFYFTPNIRGNLNDMFEDGETYRISCTQDPNITVVLQCTDLNDSTLKTLKYYHNNQAFTVDKSKYMYSHLRIQIPAGRTVSNVLFKPQIEKGTVGTEYTPYVDVGTVKLTSFGADETDNLGEYTPNADGTAFGVKSIYPKTTLKTDREGVLIECEYNKDLNKVIENLTNAIISLGGNV